MRTDIASVRAWEALDSRGTPTVACEVTLAGGASGHAIVPSGASVGSHEAKELRDGGDRYGGQGVTRAVEQLVAEIAPHVLGLDALDQLALDSALHELDGTQELSRLGGNAVLSLSVAVLLAAADSQGVPLYRHLAPDVEPLLPLPMVNVISGGAHAGGVGVDFQDFLVVPVGASSFAEALEWAWRVRRATAECAEELGLSASLVADEGGLGLPLRSSRAAVELLHSGIERSGLAPGDQASIAIDVAATQLCREGSYHLRAEQRAIDASALLDELELWCGSHPVVSLEDPLAEDDWDGWVEATHRLGARLQLIGDDLFATDSERLGCGIDARVGNAILVKPNQAGTITGSAAAVRRARAAGYAVIVSARSGETEDSWLADLAVGWQAGQIKVGSTTRSERTSKWNRLLRIESEAGEAARFAGRSALAPLAARVDSSRSQNPGAGRSK